MRKRARAILVLPAVVLSAASMAGGAQNTLLQAPVFKSKVEVVQLDVSVLDKHRQPVRGLTAKDFTVLEDGKPQAIVGFSTFDTDAEPPPAVGWMREVRPDVATNASPETRLFVIVMDDAMIPQHPAFIRDSKQIATKIIERFGPTDLAAVVFTGDNRRTQDFTNDKTKLLAAIENFNPGLAGYRFGADSGQLEIDMHFFISSVRTLSDVADYLIAVPNRRKAVFWVSPGVPFDAQDMSSQPASRPTAGSQDAPASVAIDMRDLAERTETIFKRAQLANVTINAIDPTGLGGMRGYLETKLPSNDKMLPELLKLDPSDPFFESKRTRFIARKVSALQDFLAEVAAQTGGRTVMNINDWDAVIDQIFEENASYYLVGFEPSNSKNDGTLRRLQVRVNRPDVEVRTRSSYYAPEPVKPAKTSNAKNALTPEAEALAKAMGGILPMAGMPMRVAAAPFAVPGQRLSTVAIILGLTQPVPASAANGRVTETTELLTSAFTPEGDPKGAQRHTAKVVLRAGANGDASYEVLARIDLPPGRYRLRLAATNATSARSGSVFADVTVPDYANVAFSASPVVVSSSPGRVSAPAGLLSSLLPLVPTAEREFSSTDRVTAFLRLYQSGQRPVERAQLTIRIRDAQDQVKSTETQTIRAEQFIAAAQQVEAPSSAPALPTRDARARPTPGADTPDKFVNLALRTADVKYPVALSKLAPGPHLLTFEATLGSTTIKRDVRFDVR